MPHDRQGRELAEGDRVRIPVSPVKAYQVIGNADHPNEYAPRIETIQPDTFLEGVVSEIHGGEDACNATIEVVGAPSPYTFNTRLVEKATPI